MEQQEILQQLSGLVEYSEDEKRYIFSDVFIDIMNDFVKNHIQITTGVKPKSYLDPEETPYWKPDVSLDVINND